MANDLDIYELESSKWWSEEKGPFSSLREISKHRLAVIRHWVGPAIGTVKDRVLVDLGCGGGFLAVPLSEEGARVLAVDISFGSVREAKLRLKTGSIGIQADVRNLPIKSNSADIVLLGDVLEHIEPFAAAVSEAARILVPGGLMYVNTINRTLRSYLLAIVLGEGLGFVPRGTHEHRLFITPEELTSAGKSCGLTLVDQTGERPELLKTIRSGAISFVGSSSLAVAYSALFRKG